MRPRDTKVGGDAGDGEILASSGEGMVVWGGYVFRIFDISSHD
jgi:hypothetical protein